MKIPIDLPTAAAFLIGTRAQCLGGGRRRCSEADRGDADEDRDPLQNPACAGFVGETLVLVEACERLTWARHYA